MTKAIAHTYGVAHEYRVQISYALLATCVTLALLYALNVYMVVSRTVSLQHITSQTTALQTEVGKLDAQYISLSSNITPNILKAHGLVVGTVSAYIPHAPSLGRVTLGGHEL